MGIKKTINNVLLVCGFVAIGLCTAVAVKMPDVFPTLIGITSTESKISDIPYTCFFSQLGTSDSSYKTQYFKGQKNYYWYLSWGNYGSTNHTDENDNFNMLLGWNSTHQPLYGGYSYVDEVMNEIEVKEDYNYSYLIMDFDFNLNHHLMFSFSAFENLSNSDTTLYLISSHNKGSTWEILDTMDSTNLTKDNMVSFERDEDNLTRRTTRYGLVLVSNEKSARIELNQFVAQKLSVV